MLTHKDRIRLMLKAGEFHLPRAFIQACYKTSLVDDPFVSKDHELKCIFFHVPKAAGTSLRKSIYGSKSFHIPAVRYKSIDAIKFDQYFKFCFVRNPYDRLLSAYEYLKIRCHSDMSFPDHRWAASNLTVYRDFEEFVLSLNESSVRNRIKSYIHFRDQLDWICDSNRERTILADFIGRYETISEDYERLQEKLKLQKTLPAERKNPNRKDYRKSYSTKMVDIASDIYAKDIYRLGYSFE